MTTLDQFLRNALGVPKILVLDGANLLHRARSGFALGDHFVAFNFFRQLRALVEQFEPTNVWMVLEGAPKRQLALLPEYKANRKIDPADTKKLADLESFQRQKREILDLLQSLPVHLAQHPDFEGDDTLFNLLKVVDRVRENKEVVVVSTDTDFTQLLQSFTFVKLYNPVTKKFVEAPSYDYIHWKALRGDPSDNVPGIPGVSDKRAEEMLTRPGSAVGFLTDGALVEQWRRNCEVIRFKTWTPEESAKMTGSVPTRDWERVQQRFQDWAFNSLLKDTTWAKFVATFEPLWPKQE